MHVGPPEMNVKDVAVHWVALHEQLGLGAPIADETEYKRALMVVDQLVEATQEDDAHPLWVLVSVAGDRIRAYEGRVHPWLDTCTPGFAVVMLPLPDKGHCAAWWGQRCGPPCAG
jgi:HTH-type transcriptional regulator / antitoxin HigA